MDMKPLIDMLNNASEDDFQKIVFLVRHELMHRAFNTLVKDNPEPLLVHDNDAFEAIEELNADAIHGEDGKEYARHERFNDFPDTPLYNALFGRRTA